MKKLVAITFSIFYILSHAFAQSRDTVQCKVETIATLPQSLHEISGMVYTPDGFWVLNDGDNGSFLMLLDRSGKIKKIKKVVNAPNYDWEDLAINAEGDLFIADIGNNNNTRRVLQIYKVKNPLKTEEERVHAETIEFEYARQTKFPPPAARLIYDAEATLFLNDSLYVFNKNRTKPYTGYLHIYKFPAKPGKYSVVAKDSIYLGGNNSLSAWVTGAAVSSKGNKIALLSHDKIWVIENYRNGNFKTGKVTIYKLNHYSQKEAICFDDRDNLFVADELFEKLLGGKLYRITPVK